MLRVLVVDDHEVVRLGLVTLLKRHPGFEVVGEAGSAREALELVARHLPDVVVMDVRMPEISGIEACREIVAAHAQVRVIMLTSYADDAAAVSAVMAGAAGFMLKQVSGPELIRAIETVGRGGSLLDPMLASRVLSEMRARASQRSGEDELTEQERNVLYLIGEGKTNREIAATLFLSEKTVRNYVSNILQKMGFVNRSQIAAYAARKSALGGE
ncbi:MAG: response regulator transcription factor [Bacillota bacterium]